MASWVAYEWPTLAPWEDTGETTTWDMPSLAADLAALKQLMYDVVLPILTALAPESVYLYGPGSDPSAPIIGDPGGNTEPPIDGGLEDGRFGGGREGTGLQHPLQDPCPPTWKVIGPRIAGDIDIQQMATLALLTPGVTARGVTLPAECGTPYVGDLGTAWHLQDGTVIFIPCAPTPNPVPMAFEFPLGSTAETEAADTTDWEIYNDGLYNTGLADTRLVRMGYDHTGAHTLYAYYRTYRYTPRGQLLSVSAETRVAIDAAEACP